MAIQERVLGRVVALRFHLVAAAVLAAGVYWIVAAGPSLSTVVSFFWPLFVSTGFFLVAVTVLLRISPPPEAESSGERTGEELMDYVAGGGPEATEPGARGDGDGDGEEQERELAEEEEEEDEKEEEEEHKKSQ